jgi:hypothetical protein
MALKPLYRNTASEAIGVPPANGGDWIFLPKWVILSAKNAVTTRARGFLDAG